jgi:hypothetical protein
MKKRIAFCSVAAGLALAALLPATAAGNQQPQGCGPHTLKGTYAFRNEGWFPGQAPGTRVPAAFVGVMHFDGFGGVSITNTGSVDGVVFKDGNSGGSYAVNQDCTGELPHFADLVIAGNGQSAFLIVTVPNQGVTFTGELRKQ